MCKSTPIDTYVRDNSKQGDIRWARKQWRGGDWSRECSGPYCFGVPLFRQYLTGKRAEDANHKTLPTSTGEWKTWAEKNCDDPNVAGNPAYVLDDKSGCNFPFARLAGANIWQRNAMTVNYGKYYIDTTRSDLTQRHSEALGRKDDPNADFVECDWKTKPGNCEPRSVNVFQKGGTYYVFLLFAKANTKQTYQLYVGENFDFKTVKGVRFTGRDISFKKQDDWTMPDSWKPRWAKGPDGKDIKGVIEVTMNFADVRGLDGKSVEFDPKKTTSETCGPKSFCSWSGSTCGCNIDDKDPRLLTNPGLKSYCKQTCGQWAVRDLDCPEIGCLGFAFTLPQDFEAKDQYKRPMPEEFPSLETNADWKQMSFIPATEGPDAGSGGDCYYSPANTPGYYLANNQRTKSACQPVK